MSCGAYQVQAEARRKVGVTIWIWVWTGPSRALVVDRGLVLAGEARQRAEQQREFKEKDVVLKVRHRRANEKTNTSTRSSKRHEHGFQANMTRLSLVLCSGK